MRLKSLKLTGFKSFAKSTVLDFPHAISAIVGPNGSGKSNVAEAIAWVLGEQSIKTLRGKKGEDLIFNGSDAVSRMSKASAALVFSAEEGEDAVIKRVVYRDGVNEYFLNDNKCRLKDVVEFLSSMGLGTSRHHIISQGEADRMLLASSKERKEMVEDALGLKIYQIKKEEGLRKLNRTEDNIDQINSLRNEIKPHLRFLKKQISKVEKARELEEKLKNLYSSYFSKSKLLILKKKKLIDEKEKEPKAEIDLHEKKIKELKEKLLKFSKEKERLSEARDEVNNLEREIGRQEGLLSQARVDAEAKPRQEKKIIISPQKIEEFSEFLKNEIDNILKEEDISKIKDTLMFLKERVSVFFRGAEESLDEVKIKEPKEKIKKLEGKYNELLEKLKTFKERETKIIKENEEAMEFERKIHQHEMKLSEIRNRIRSFEIDEEKTMLKEEDLKEERAEAKAILGHEVILKDVGNDFDDGDIDKERREIEKIKIKLEESGSVGEEIMREYEEVQKRDDFLAQELQDLEKAADSLKDLVSRLEENLANDFKEGFDKINREFHNFFEIMFGGGSASLKILNSKSKTLNKSQVQNSKYEDEELLPEIEEPEEKIEEGVEINVSLPRKRIKGLSMLSGGERALTSIALLFAMSQVNPPPFLILDETDAALDESNSRKYAEMLKDLSKKTQLILVTHNRETMKSAGVLYGVTMGADSISRLLSVKFDEAEDLAALDK